MMFSRVALVFVAALAVASVVQAYPTVVPTQAGQVGGYTTLDGTVDVWRGIPYAAPPVGPLRFAVPTPPASWTGVKSTILAGQICPQFHDIIPGKWLGGEDCLYLDVYAPSNRTAGTLLPVWVWIYGGGWDLGDGLEFGLYDGVNFANKHEVIIVTFNYRLGPLGFLALDAFQQENPQGSVGSYGIYDQVFALNWVQNNIEGFGGDPNQVTIAGESAGAFSTCIHLVSPLSKGLFKNAILESGTCSSQIFYQPLQDSIDWGSSFAAHVGCDPSTMSNAEVLTCIRGIDMPTVMGPAVNYTWSGYHPLMFPVMPWASTIDNVLMTNYPFELITAGQFNPVTSVLMGTNHDEGTLFVSRMSTVVPSMHKPLQPGDLDLLLDHFFDNNSTVNALVSAMYPAANYPNTTVLIEVMMRDFFFLCPSSRVLLALHSFGVPTWLYQFVYKGDWIEDPVMGVYHSAELEFVFDNAWPPIIHTFSARDQTMSDTFGYYWSNMIKYNNPNGNGGNSSSSQTFWPNYDYDLNSMSLDVPSSVVSGLQEQQCELWDKIVAWLPPGAKQNIKQAKEVLVAEM